MKNKNIDVDVKLLKRNEVEESLRFQQGVFDDMACQEWFHLMTRDEFTRAIEGRGKVGFLMSGGKKMGIFTFAYDEDDYLKEYEVDNKNMMILHGVMVKKEYRGMGLQRRILQMAKEDAKRNKTDGIVATVHPDNVYSLRNFLVEGFKIIKKLGFIMIIGMWCICLWCNV